MFFDCAAQRFETIREREREKRVEREAEASLALQKLPLLWVYALGVVTHCTFSISSAAQQLERFGVALAARQQGGVRRRSRFTLGCASSHAASSACRPASESACKMRAAPQSKKDIRK
jgi:hypothetical protein